MKGISSSSTSPDLELGILEARFVDRDLRAGILDRLDDGAEPHDAHAALQLVDVQLEADVGTEFARQRGVNAVAQQLQEIGAIELFRRRQLAKRGQHFGGTSHAMHSLHVGCRGRSGASG